MSDVFVYSDIRDLKTDIVPQTKRGSITGPIE